MILDNMSFRIFGNTHRIWSLGARISIEFYTLITEIFKKLKTTIRIRDVECESTVLR